MIVLSKSKKEHDKKKPVKDVIEMTFDEPVSSSAIIINGANFSILQSDGKGLLTPDNVVHKRISTRGEGNKAKIVSSLQNCHNVSPIVSARKFPFDSSNDNDYIFAIDTNDKTIGDRVICCTASVSVSDRKLYGYQREKKLYR